MSRRSKILTAATAGALMAIGTAASSFANSNFAYNGSPSTYTGGNTSSVYIEHNTTITGTGGLSSYQRLSGASDTASFYYRVGVRQFEKGNFDRAEEAFNAVLLADGLNQQAHYYLAKINIEQGDKETAVKHTRALETYKTPEK